MAGKGDVCLFDHMKITAAFADCLYMYSKENPEFFKMQDDTLVLLDGIKPVLLVGWDLSGIQKFIYNISSRKAAMSLKGRSFYLQMLVDSLIQRIIKHPEINASSAHIVYSSGGKFYMLLPNNENVKIALEEISATVEEEMWSEHYGQLVVNFDFVPFGYVAGFDEVLFGDNSRGNISLLWKSLADRLTVKKNNKFKGLLLEKYSDFFDVNKVGGKDFINITLCIVLIELIKALNEKTEGGEDEDAVCSALLKLCGDVEHGFARRDHIVHNDCVLTGQVSAEVLVRLDRVLTVDNGGVVTAFIEHTGIYAKNSSKINSTV